MPEIRVLCRRWADAFEYITNIENDQRILLKQIHDFYRYQVDTDLTKEFDVSKIDWIKNVKIVISIYKAINIGNFAGILNELSKIFDIDLLKLNKRTNGKELKEIIKFIDMFKTFNSSDIYFDIINKINNFMDNTSLKIFEKLPIVYEGDEMYNYNFHPMLYNLNINTMLVMNDEVFTENSKYVTIHKTKGKEYDSVLVNLVPIYEEKKLGGILKVLENPIIFDEKNDAATEFVRIAYVAFSRAKNNLYIHLKNTKKEIESMINNLNEYCFKNNINEKIYEIIDLND